MGEPDGLYPGLHSSLMTAPPLLAMNLPDGGDGIYGQPLAKQRRKRHKQVNQLGKPKCL